MTLGWVCMFVEFIKLGTRVTMLREMRGERGREGGVGGSKN